MFLTNITHQDNEKFSLEKAQKNVVDRTSIHSLIIAGDIKRNQIKSYNFYQQISNVIWQIYMTEQQLETVFMIKGLNKIEFLSSHPKQQFNFKYILEGNFIFYAHLTNVKIVHISATKNYLTSVKAPLCSHISVLNISMRTSFIPQLR